MHNKVVIQTFEYSYQKQHRNLQNKDGRISRWGRHCCFKARLGSTQIARHTCEREPHTGFWWESVAKGQPGRLKRSQ